MRVTTCVEDYSTLSGRKTVIPFVENENSIVVHRNSYKARKSFSLHIHNMVLIIPCTTDRQKSDRFMQLKETNWPSPGKRKPVQKNIRPRNPYCSSIR